MLGYKWIRSKMNLYKIDDNSEHVVTVVNSGKLDEDFYKYACDFYEAAEAVIEYLLGEAAERHEIYKLDLKTIILFKNKSFSSQLIRLVKKLRQDSYELDEYEHPNKTYKDGISRGIKFHKDVDIDKELVRVGNIVIDDLEKIYKFHENLQQSLLQTMRETRDFNILESVYKRKD